MRKFSLLMISAALVALVAVGCGGGGTKKTITVGDQKFTAGGSLPDDFPKDFPIYGGADFKGSITSTQQGQSGSAATWQTGDSLDKVKAYYKDQFDGKSNWAQDSAADTGQGSFYAVHRKSDTKAGFLTLTSQDNQTIILVFVGDNLGDATSESGSADDNKTATADAKTAESDGSAASDTPAPADLPPAVTIAKDFPKDRVPLPSGARVTSTSSLTSGGTSTFFVEVYLKDSPDNVSSYFKDELPKHNWTNALTSEASGTFFMTFTSGDTSTGSGDSVSITIEQSDTPGYAKASIAVSLTS